MKKPGEELQPAAPNTPEQQGEPIRRHGRSIEENGHFQLIAFKFGSLITENVVALGDNELKRAMENEGMTLPSSEVVRQLEQRKPGTMDVVFEEIRKDNSIEMRRKEVRAIVGILRAIYPFNTSRKRK